MRRHARVHTVLSRKLVLYFLSSPAGAEDGWTRLSRAGLTEAAASRLLDEYTVAREAAHSIGLGNASRRHGEQAGRVQSAMRRAFAHDAGVARSVCYLLIPDYVCLAELLGPERAYELPAPCRQPLQLVLRHLTDAEVVSR